MNDYNNLNKFIDTIVDIVIKKIKQESDYKSSMKTKNATVISVETDDNDSTLHQNVELRLPYDKETFTAKNQSGEELAAGDLVVFSYWFDIKNAIVVSKNKV